MQPEPTLVVSILLLGLVAGADAQTLTNMCRFTGGPKAGQTESFPQTMPIPVGAPCQDGAFSWGYAVVERQRTARPQQSDGFSFEKQKPSCVVEGRSIPYISTRALPKSGLATKQGTQPVILISKTNTLGFSVPLMVFLFAHECGHHALGHVQYAMEGGFIGPEEELAADCFAKRNIMTVLSDDQYSQITAFLRRIPGDPTTFPGPERVRRMNDC